MIIVNKQKKIKSIHFNNDINSVYTDNNLVFNKDDGTFILRLWEEVDDYPDYDAAQEFPAYIEDGKIYYTNDDYGGLQILNPDGDIGRYHYSRIIEAPYNEYVCYYEEYHWVSVKRYAMKIK